MNPHERRKLDVPEEIETDRLLLRILRAGDGEAIYQAVMDSLPRLSPWLRWVNDNPTLERNELYVREAYVDYLNREALEYGIFLKDDQTVIGRIGVHKAISWDPIIREFGYWIRTGYEGKGYMSEAVQALLRMLFEEMNTHKVIIRAEKTNELSKNVAVRNGFTYEGTARHMAPNPLTGEMADWCGYSLLRSEWEEDHEGC